MHIYGYYIFVLCFLLMTTINLIFLKFYISHSDSLIQLSSQFIMSGWGTGYSFHCDLVNYSESPQALRVCLPHICLRMYCEIVLCTYMKSLLSALVIFSSRWQQPAGFTISQSSLKCWTQ